MPVQDTETFVRRKLADIQLHLDSPEPNLPECTDEDLWRKAPTYAYYANPDATGRCTKRFDTLREANLHYAEKGKGRVETRPGQVKACAYCSAAPLCTQRLRYLDEQL